MKSAEIQAHGRDSCFATNVQIPENAGHRPWPLPGHPWVLKQGWNNLLFAHWPVAHDKLRERVPRYFELDVFDNQTWVSITPFHLTDLSPRGVPPLPWVSAFNEINVRTYVTYAGIPGVFFFSLDANSALAVAGASSLFHLPYYLADIRVEEAAERLLYESRRGQGNARFRAQYGPVGALFTPKAGTLDYWLTERYCLYTCDANAKAYRVEIHHAPWQLQYAEARIVENTMADAAGINLPPTAPVLHYSLRQDVLTWLPQGLS